jgi:pyruvate formate lyase activating enzyme
MDKGIVFDIMRFSTRDGPGIRTTVFLKGCPLACQWCHNPESQKTKPELMLRPGLCINCQECVNTCSQGAISVLDGTVITDPAHCNLCGECVEVCYAEARAMVGREMTVSEVIAEVMKDAPFYEESGGGVTFSGGEVFTQPGFLLELVKACKQRDLNITIDTCGFVQWTMLEKTIPYVDLYLYDLKVIDDETHRKYTGVSNQLILSNLSKLAEYGARIIVRIPVVPGVNDTEQSLHELAEVVSSMPQIERLELLPYHQAGVEKYNRLNRPYHLLNTISPTSERMDHIAQIFRSAGISVQTGG